MSEPLPPHLDGQLWEVHAETKTGRTSARPVDDLTDARAVWVKNRGGDTGIYVLISAVNENLAKEVFRSDEAEEGQIEQGNASVPSIKYFYVPE